MTEKIKILMIKRNVTVKELATAIGVLPSNFSRKLARNNFSHEDFVKIGDALNCDYEPVFTMRDTGKKI